MFGKRLNGFVVSPELEPRYNHHDASITNELMKYNKILLGSDNFSPNSPISLTEQKNFWVIYE